MEYITTFYDAFYHYELQYAMQANCLIFARKHIMTEMIFLGELHLRKCKHRSDRNDFQMNWIDAKRDVWVVFCFITEQHASVVSTVAVISGPALFVFQRWAVLLDSCASAD